MRSYNLDALKASYTRGTRLWLYNDINAWLSASVYTTHSGVALPLPLGGPPDELPLTSGTCTAATSSSTSGLMYMLLAGPGMGKSVFSASVDSKLAARVDQGIELVRQ